MKKLLALLALACASIAFADTIPTTGFYVDLYGNLFKDGQNLNRKVSDYARDPAHFGDGPALDAAITDVALRGRDYIAAQIKVATDTAAATVASKETEKQAAITAAQQASASAIAANAAELAAAKDARDKLTAHVAVLNAYIATVRATVTQLGGATAAPPTPPQL